MIVLIIVYRLDIIIDYDRVIVLEKGCVVEFDKLSVFLNKRGSYFVDLVKSYNKIVFL